MVSEKMGYKAREPDDIFVEGSLERRFVRLLRLIADRRLSPESAAEIMERWVDEIDGEAVLSDPRVMVHYPKILALIRWVQSRSRERAKAKGRDSHVLEERFPGSLVRKLRKTGRSLTLTIPKDLVDLYDLRPGALIQIEPISRDAIRISKLKREGEEAGRDGNFRSG
jgi:hypothetical protein